MKSITFSATVMCTLACIAWGGCWYFSRVIDDQKNEIASQLAKGKTFTAQRESISASLALANATESDRKILEAAADRDILSLSNLISEAGQHAGVPIVIVSVSPGPGPVLPKGSPLHPSSILYAVKTSGSYAQVVTAMSFLESLPAVSTLESIQFSRGEGSGQWNANATLRIITTSSLSS